MPPVSTAEKIAAIVLSRHSDRLGKLTEYIPGWFRVDADDLCVLVRGSRNGWHVCFRGTETVHDELYIAARMALEKGLALTRRADFLLDTACW
jgi:hypothetical protein